ncbi:MAG: flippase-like domain-containing protein [Anaerolineaceae bacterium]|nr:flippase-like domain-containing protein [Anaerolineaceae bacterium]
MAMNLEPENQQSKSKTSWIKLAGTVISVLLFIWLMTRFGWQELLQSMLQIKPGAILIAFGLMLLSRFVVSMRWYFLCRSNHLQISITNAIQLTFAGLYASNFLPSTIGGDVVRYLGGIQLDSQKVKCAGSLIMDRLVGMFGMVLVLPFGLIDVLPMLMRGELDMSTDKPATGFALVISERFRVLYQKIRKALHDLFVQIGDWVRHPLTLVMPLLMTFLHMLLLFGIINLIFNGMGDKVPFLLIAGLYSVGYFITLIPISINGYGLQEISITILFVNVAGVSTSHAVIMALMIRFLMMTASLPGMFLLPKILPDTKAKLR